MHTTHYKYLPIIVGYGAIAVSNAVSWLTINYTAQQAASRGQTVACLAAGAIWPGVALLGGGLEVAQEIEKSLKKGEATHIGRAIVTLPVSTLKTAFNLTFYWTRSLPQSDSKKSH